MPITNYIWDVVNDSVLMETDETGATTAVYTSEPVKYGRLISQNRGNATNYYHFDGQGSTRQLTDVNQNVTDEYTYSALGETVASSGTTNNPFRYKGEFGYFTDSPSSQCYVRSRILDSPTGRWLTPDPLAYWETPNPYLYVRNNPILFIDSSGLKCIVCSWARYKGPGPSLAQMDKEFANFATPVTSSVSFIWNFVFVQDPQVSQKYTTTPPLPTTVGPIVPFRNTRPFGRIKVGEETMFGHLFVITADVCETNPGDCRVTIDERVVHKIKKGPDAPFVVDRSEVKPTKTYKPSSTGPFVTMIGDLADPRDPRCNKRIVIPDTPMRSQYLAVQVLRIARVDQEMGIFDVTDQNRKWSIRQVFVQGALPKAYQHFDWYAHYTPTVGNPAECC